MVYNLIFKFSFAYFASGEHWTEAHPTVLTISVGSKCHLSLLPGYFWRCLFHSKIQRPFNEFIFCSCLAVESNRYNVCMRVCCDIVFIMLDFLINSFEKYKIFLRIAIKSEWNVNRKFSEDATHYRFFKYCLLYHPIHFQNSDHKSKEHCFSNYLESIEFAKRKATNSCYWFCFHLFLLCYYLHFIWFFFPQSTIRSYVEWKEDRASSASSSIHNEFSCELK